MLKKIISLLIILLLSLYFQYFFITSFTPLLNQPFNNLLETIPLINISYIFYILKIIFPITSYISSVIFAYIFTKKYINMFFNTISHFDKSKTVDTKYKNYSENYLIGKNITNTPIYLSLDSLYQNVLITGSIGSGKTSSVIYPLLSHLSDFPGLILDVKGNMKDTIENILIKKNLLDKLITIEINGKYKYNPLNKPNLKPYIIANRLTTILKLLSNEKQTDTYWFDKVEQFFTESIKLIRLYNNDYVNFIELNQLIVSPKYIIEKISYVKDLFMQNSLSKQQQFNFNSVLTYFQYEYAHLDSKLLSTILSEASRITTPFVNDFDILSTFSPSKDEQTFNGFFNILSNNYIVLLKMNIGQYQTLSKIIATYLKLDFQLELLQKNNNTIPCFFICDEYQEYVTETDATFFSLSREYKIINIVATQSYSSLLNTLSNEHTLQVITQNLINKFFLRTDDTYTINIAQKLFGKIEKTKISKTISENANQTNYNYLFNIMRSNKSGISESISTYIQNDNLFDSTDFSLSLKSFEAIAYLSQGSYMLKPQKIFLSPYFIKEDFLNEI